MELPAIEVLVVNGLIAGAAVLGVLSIFASRLGHACEMHDLKRDVERLKAEYAARLAALREEHDGSLIEAEVIGQIGEEEARALAA